MLGHAAVTRPVLTGGRGPGEGGPGGRVGSALPGRRCETGRRRPGVQHPHLVGARERGRIGRVGMAQAAAELGDGLVLVVVVCRSSVDMAVTSR